MNLHVWDIGEDRWVENRGGAEDAEDAEARAGEKTWLRLWFGGSDRVEAERFQFPERHAGAEIDDASARLIDALIARRADLAAIDGQGE